MAMAYKYKSLVLEDQCNKLQLQIDSFNNKFISDAAMLIYLLQEKNDEQITINKDKLSYIIKKIQENKYLIKTEKDINNYYLSFSDKEVNDAKKNN